MPKSSCDGTPPTAICCTEKSDAPGQQPLQVGLAKARPPEDGWRLAAERRRRWTGRKTRLVQVNGGSEDRRRAEHGVLEAMEHPVRGRLVVVEYLHGKCHAAGRDLCEAQFGEAQNTGHEIPKIMAEPTGNYRHLFELLLNARRCQSFDLWLLLRPLREAADQCLRRQRPERLLLFAPRGSLRTMQPSHARQITA